MTTKNLHQRLHAVMSEVDYVQKEKKGGMRYSIVSHDAVTAKVRPVLVKHGIVYYPVGMVRSQNGSRTEIDLTVRFTNIDAPSDFIDVVACGYGVDEQDKGPGKAISYAVKYCLLKALGLETGDDPDSEQDERVQHKPAASPPPKPQHFPPPSRASKPVYELLDADSALVPYNTPDDWCRALQTALRQPGAHVRTIWETNKPLLQTINDQHPALRWEIKGQSYHPYDVLAALYEKLAPGMAA